MVRSTSHVCIAGMTTSIDALYFQEGMTQASGYLYADQTLTGFCSIVSLSNLAQDGLPIQTADRDDLADARADWVSLAEEVLFPHRKHHTPR